MVEETRLLKQKEQERLEEIAQLNQPKTHTAFNEAGKFQNNTDDFKTLEELMESRQNDATLTQEENTDGEGDDEFMSSCPQSQPNVLKSGKLLLLTVQISQKS